MNRSKLEIRAYTKQYKKTIIFICFLSFVVYLFLKFIFTIFGDKMETDEIYDFINKSVDRCLQKNTRYEQNKEFSLIKTALPIKPIKMTLTTAVFLLEDYSPYKVLKRIIVNKKTPIFEDKIAKKLNHLNIVKSFDSIIKKYRDINNESQTIIWLYMEYLPIKISQSYVRKNEKIIRDLAYDVLLGLKYLHDKNIAHLDLKIANIMGFNYKGQIRYKIIDFGYSRVVDKEVYLPGKNYGTFPYKPPEVVFNNIHGLKGDIWCFGAILLFLRLEETPFYDSSNRKNKPLYDKFLLGRYKIKYPKGISYYLKDFIKGCMIHDRHKRPTADTLLRHKLFNEKEGILFDHKDSSSETYDSGFESEYNETEESLDMEL